jgi:hypothetical protein
MQPTTPRFPRPGPPRVSMREQLSLRRRRNAMRIGAATVTALFACWLMLRAEPAAPFQRVAGWLEDAFDSANANLLAKARRATPAVGAQRPPQPETVPLRPELPSVASRVRSGADLRGPESAAEAEATRAGADAASRGPAAGAPVAAAPKPSAPSERPPVYTAPEEPAPPAAAGPGDVLGDLVPSDFEGTLGGSAAVGGIAADVAVNLDVDLGGGEVAVDTGTRVETPIAAIDVGTQIGVGAAGADVGATVAVGPAAVATQIGVGPDRVAVVANAAGGDVRIDLGDAIAAGVDLEGAGIPVSVAIDASGGTVAFDASAGGGTAPLGDLLDTLPLNLPIRLH